MKQFKPLTNESKNKMKIKDKVKAKIDIRQIKVWSECLEIDLNCDYLSENDIVRLNHIVNNIINHPNQ